MTTVKTPEPAPACPACGKSFAPYRRTQKFCSRRCHDRMRASEMRRHAREYLRQQEVTADVKSLGSDHESS